MEVHMDRKTENTTKRRKIEVDITNPTSVDQSSIYLIKENLNNTIKTTDEVAGINERRLSKDYIDWQLKRIPEKTEQPNHILLFTVFNPSYAITCDILCTICSPIATVLRIVIFKKNGIQAMIEFDSVENAGAVKECLHGCDIYNGCCTLKVEYSRTIRLNVHKNNNESSWDYTDGFVETKSDICTLTPRRVLLEEPNHQKVNENGNSNSIFASPNDLPKNITTINSTNTAEKFSMSKGLIHGSVCIVYGLNMDEMNTTKLFNLICLYGNVIRIKFLKTKEGCAMVQMGDSLAVERIISFLHNTTLFGSRLYINYSKQSVLVDVHAPYQLKDGTLSFKDFSHCNINRFSTPEAASKNRIQRPSNTLHFFNTPPNIGSDGISSIFTTHDQNLKPNYLKLFNSKSEKSSSGLVEFDNLERALEALALCNHQPVQSPNTKHPYIMKLCFSTSSSCC